MIEKVVSLDINLDIVSKLLNMFLTVPFKNNGITNEEIDAIAKIRNTIWKKPTKY
jgi:hypothetical protein